MAQQEGNSDLSTKFFTLNVNAMEFVPSFCGNAPSAAAPDSEAATATAPTANEAVDESVPEPDNTPKSQDVSPTKTNDELPVSVPAPTELMDDKSPDNPGAYFNRIHISKRMFRFSVAQFDLN